MKNIILFVCTIVFIILCIRGFNLYTKELTYYTRVDNNKISSINSDDNMKFEYKLIAYDKSGNKKEIKFKTSRKLRNKAYLKLKYYNISGVNKWEEIEYKHLPNKVKEKYK